MLETLLVWLMTGLVTAQLPFQNRPKPDISLEESRKISPFPPASVRVRREKGRAVIEWQRVPLDKIIAYEIFRRVNSGQFKKIAQLQAPPFVDKHPPKGDVVYAVASIDRFNNRSKLKEEDRH